MAAHPLFLEIFRYAERHNLDSFELTSVLADALASTAASIELYGPPESRCSLNDRIDVFVERVRERYPKIISDMITTKSASAR